MYRDFKVPNRIRRRVVAMLNRDSLARCACLDERCLHDGAILRVNHLEEFLKDGRVGRRVALKESVHLL